jgi:alpha-glucosidase (family GH31 glycosyl hydrolase)
MRRCGASHREGAGVDWGARVGVIRECTAAAPTHKLLPCPSAPCPQVLVDHLLADPVHGGGGLSGFMADFGEELPLAAGLGLWDPGYGNLTPAQLHNAWPLLWQTLCGEAAALAQAQGVLPNGTTADDIVFFTRSAAAQTPNTSRLIWLGDQLTTWDGYDGLASAVTGLISSGFSGFALSHSDIGGYTSWDGARIGLPGIRVTRSPELFARWSEFAAFTPVYRTHPGSDNANDWQFDSDNATAALFARMAAVHAAWAFYSQELQAGDVAVRGWPLARSLGLQFPGDDAALDVQDAFILGTELLIAPVLQPNVTRRWVYLPASPTLAWTHVWTGANWSVSAAGPGRNVSVEAPLGSPPVFYPAGSGVGARFAANLCAAQLLPPPRCQ